MYTISVVIIVLTVILIITCSVQLIILANRCKKYLGMWRRWEQEYWLLRGSDAVNNDDFEIHLSWLERGQEFCIRKRKHEQ